MKWNIIAFFLVSYSYTFCQPLPKVENIVIVTIDGVRWQEIFEGPDIKIINDEKYTADPTLARLMYYDSSKLVSRKKLLPFFWNVIEQKGRLYGNRNYDNHVGVTNIYNFSYPGYNEIFTGYPDIGINSNEPINNPNTNVLEYLNSLDEFKNKVVTFSSWNIFPYILNTSRNEMPVYSGYDPIKEDGDFNLHVFNKLQENKNIITEKGDTRQDVLTFISASAFMKIHKPKILLLGFGECDEDAHAGKYDKYLQHLNEADKMIQQLWYFIQSTPGYKNNTALIITTDHGRGFKKTKWTSHDIFVNGSGHIWLAVIAPGLQPLGEVQQSQQIYQSQIAATISSLLGYDFKANHPVAQPIALKHE